ncbi:MAG: hypothetical protein NTW10_04165 [Bacteroidetes bacterium]|nr:hypothetical protein [Bacteroidota bacterium]
MKTKIILQATRAILIIALCSGFQIQSLMAKLPSNNTPEKNTLTLSNLAPVAPREATFEDGVPEKAPSMVSLAPVTPTVATFEDTPAVPEISAELLKKVAPVTPAEADFSDISSSTENDTDILEFVVPFEAGFGDF